MKLDSVRELKQSLTSSLLPKIQATLATRMALGRPAGPIARTLEPPLSVALGVAPGGHGEFRLAVRLQKRAFEESREVAAIIKKAKGEVDVRYVGRIGKRTTPWHRLPQRPLLIGCSVGHYKITAGTLGCFVVPRSGGEVGILSNNHVLANENGARKGDAILQPGEYDFPGGMPANRAATLTSFVRLKRNAPNFVDGAFATLAPEIDGNLTKLRGLGRLAGMGAAFVDEGAEVAKIGRTTGLTRGRVTAFELDNVVVGFGIGDLRFDNQIEIEGAEDGPFSEGGDSGSLIVDADYRGIALLFAGGDQGGSNGQGLTYANPLHTVLDALALDLAT